MEVGTGREDGRKVGQGRIREAGSGEPGPPWGSARQPGRSHWAPGLRTVPVRHSDADLDQGPWTRFAVVFYTRHLQFITTSEGRTQSEGDLLAPWLSQCPELVDHAPAWLSAHLGLWVSGMMASSHFSLKFPLKIFHCVLFIFVSVTERVYPAHRQAMCSAVVVTIISDGLVIFHLQLCCVVQISAENKVKASMAKCQTYPATSAEIFM